MDTNQAHFLVSPHILILYIRSIAGCTILPNQQVFDRLAGTGMYIYHMIPFQWPQGLKARSFCASFFIL